MTLRMGDAVNVANLPSGLDAYAGYVDGQWPTYPRLVAQFPKAKHLSIAVSASGVADCLDVEPGDATNAQVLGWLAKWDPAGKNTDQPVIYTSASNAGLMIQEAGRKYLLWTAHYTNTAHICRSTTCWPATPIAWVADGTQWTDHLGKWDESVLLDQFFPPAPQPPVEEPVTAPNIFVAIGPDLAVYVINELLNTRKWVPDSTGAAAYEGLYGKAIPLTTEDLKQYTPVGHPGPNL